MKKLLCILACLAAASSVMAAVNFVWNNTAADNDWANPVNWGVGYVPTNGSLVLINHPTLSLPGGACNIGSGDRIAQVVYVYDGTFTLAAGATLKTGDAARYTQIGYQSSLTATADIAGTWRIADVRGIRLGLTSGASGILNVTGDGNITCAHLELNGVGTAEVNILGGTIQLNIDADTSLLLDAANEMRIENDGQLILTGNRTNLVNGYVTSGYLYTTNTTPLGAAYNTGLNQTYVSVGQEEFPPISIGDISIEVTPVE